MPKDKSESAARSEDQFASRREKLTRTCYSDSEGDGVDLLLALAKLPSQPKSANSGSTAKSSTMNAKLPRQAKSEYDELLLLLEHGLPWPMRQIWHKSPDHLELLLVKGGLILPKGFLSKALKTNQNNARGWGPYKYRKKSWYCFDVQYYLQHTKFKYDTPKRQMQLLTEVPTISDNHFHSFQLNYLNKYTNQANIGNPPNTNPSPPISTPAPANNNPQRVTPSAPDNSTPVPGNNNLSHVTPSASNNPAPTNSAVPTPAEAGAAFAPISNNTMPRKTSQVDFTPAPTDANPVSVTPSTPGDAHVDIPLLPSLEKIVAGVTKRMDFIGNDDISNDDYLTLAAKLLTMHSINRIEIGCAKVFIVCKGCSKYRVCRKQVTNSDVCRTCQKKDWGKKFHQKRREENHASRISPHSSVPLTSLTKDELIQRGRAERELHDERRRSKKLKTQQTHSVQK